MFGVFLRSRLIRHSQLYLLRRTICATRLYRSLMTFGHQTVVLYVFSFYYSRHRSIARLLTHTGLLSDTFLATAPLASIQPTLRFVRNPQNSSGGAPSLTVGSVLTGNNASLEVEFPTSYGHYRAEDPALGNDRLKAINEEGEERVNDKANGEC